MRSEKLMGPASDVECIMVIEMVEGDRNPDYILFLSFLGVTYMVFEYYLMIITLSQ